MGHGTEGHGRFPARVATGRPWFRGILGPEVPPVLLLIGVLLLVIWAAGLLIFHMGAVIYIALVAGLAVIAFHWWSHGAKQKQ